MVTQSISLGALGVCLEMKARRIPGEPQPSFHIERLKKLPQHEQKLAAVADTEYMPSAPKKEGRQTKSKAFPWGFLASGPHQEGAAFCRRVFPSPLILPGTPSQTQPIL